MHIGEIVPEEDLPLRYCGLSSCFRREAGTAGKDMRGIFRTHQFEKVEMFSFLADPDRSWDEHEYLLSIEREIADELGLHYRVMNIAAGDLGAPAAKKYDIEVWLPGQGRYRELTSCSNTTDFQARRLDARYRSEAGVRHLHTLNGTAVTSSAPLCIARARDAPEERRQRRHPGGAARLRRPGEGPACARTTDVRAPVRSCARVPTQAASTISATATPPKSARYSRCPGTARSGLRAGRRHGCSPRRAERGTRRRVFRCCR